MVPVHRRPLQCISQVTAVGGRAAVGTVFFFGECLDVLASGTAVLRGPSSCGLGNFPPGFRMFENGPPLPDRSARVRLQRKGES